jgi:DNA ligase-1
MLKFILYFIPFILWAGQPKLLLLKNYSDQNITGWVMSEKLDGIRAYWNGKNLLTRNGNIIHAPKWFVKNYPKNVQLDGELWTKRRDYENIASIVLDKTPSRHWHQIKHYIFEVPDAPGNLFERLKIVKKYESQYIKVIEQIEIKNKDHLNGFLKEVEQKGGEGLVIRDPSTEYINKRTNKALKVKNFKDDECKIIGYNEGKGKFKGLVGSFNCRLKNGIEFKLGIGLSNHLRKNPPKLGTIATFKYKELTKYGKPKFASFLRIRSQE